ncbi:DUF4337 family protein [Rhodopila sp.]|uniref:DUF4337 family protein n=1 Tax=Rhodopila sp. TaxID=2480087 RepID=UPI002BBC7247|nr:DUF4337 family protein [Rhodopila sp.]HVZ09108.1 DUF4337 family protein [Rhodopila sp.]
MSDPLERSIEDVKEEAERGGDWARGVAVLVALMAAALALTGIGEKSTQNDYLSAHIASSDDWSFYQAKNQRAAMRGVEISILESLPNADTPEVQARIKAAREYIKHAENDPQAGDGMKQLADKATEREHEREHVLHRYHGYEMAAGALELAIVLASVSVVIRSRPLTIGAAVLGVIGAVASLAVRLSLF